MIIFLCVILAFAAYFAGTNYTESSYATTKRRMQELKNIADLNLLIAVSTLCCIIFTVYFK